MSVFLISDGDLVRLARFAAAHMPLPSGLCADTLAARFRAANIQAWRDQYPDAANPALAATPTACAPKDAPGSSREMLEILRTTRDLRYNAAIEPRTLLSGILIRAARRAGQLRMGTPH
jgi:hypothetical protein